MVYKRDMLWFSFPVKEIKYFLALPSLKNEKQKCLSMNGVS